MRKWNVRALLREPLLHFLLIGLALFFVYGRVSPSGGDTHRIVVSQSQIDDMVSQYQANFNRPPTRTELKDLVDRWVRDEILYREGLSLGLDKDDPVIKRRILQKFELIAEEAEQADPTDADLSAFLKSHPAEFMRPAVVSFDQLFFDPASTSPKAVDAVKAALAKGADTKRFGQPSMLPAHVEQSSIALVARDFGDDFAKQLAAAPVGHWSGPVASGIGVHLVRVSARTAPELPPLQAVRAAVAREWESDRRTRSSEDSYRKARADYDIVVKAKLP